jgi:hypothetical protein
MEKYIVLKGILYFLSAAYSIQWLRKDKCIPNAILKMDYLHSRDFHKFKVARNFRPYRKIGTVLQHAFNIPHRLFTKVTIGRRIQTQGA